MRKMKTPEMDVIRFDESDVIVASGGGTVPAGILRVSGLDNYEAGDGKFAFGTHSYTTGTMDSADFYNQLNDTFQSSWGTISNSTSLNYDGGGTSLGWAIGDDLKGSNAWGLDGDYTWNGSSFSKQ